MNLGSFLPHILGSVWLVPLMEHIVGRWAFGYSNLILYNSEKHCIK
jgi:hypothetical protein